MIIKIHRGQPELLITAAGPGARYAGEGPMQIVIRAPAPPPWAGVSPIHRLGDWGYPPVREYPPRPEALPSIVYPLFDVDDEGRLVFRLDGKLWSRPPGRYVGTVQRGPKALFDVSLDLFPLAWRPSRIEQTDEGCS